MAGNPPSGYPELATITFEKVAVEQTLQLRRDVLWTDKSLEQVRLVEDEQGHHFGAFLADQTDPIAVISFIEGLPIDNESDRKNDHLNHNDDNQIEVAVPFRKLACNPKFQGRGIGTHLLMHALSMARSEMDATVAWCDARTTAVEWYSRRGFRTFGAAFFKGPVKYIRMRMPLEEHRTEGGLRMMAATDVRINSGDLNVTFCPAPHPEGLNFDIHRDQSLNVTSIFWSMDFIPPSAKLNE